MPLGIVFGETSTTEFDFLFGDQSGDVQNELKFAYVQIDLDDDKVVARVVDVESENPLLSEHTAKFYSERTNVAIPDLMSKRFTLYRAKCEVIGQFKSASRTVEPLTQGIKPGETVDFLAEEILSELFSGENPWDVHLGRIASPAGQARARVSLNADSILTKHACVFGMTGMGKTTTTATLIEELMFRGSKLVVFDPHGDYSNMNEINPDFAREIRRTMPFGSSLRDDIQKLSSMYHDGLRQEMERLNQAIDINFWSHYDGEFANLGNPHINPELRRFNLLYRMLGFSSARMSMMSDPNSQDESSDLKNSLSSTLEMNWGHPLLSKVRSQNIAMRKLTIKFNAYPTLKVYRHLPTNHTRRILEAFAGERFTDAQIGYIARWLDDLKPQNSQDSSPEDDSLLDNLDNRANTLLNNERTAGTGHAIKRVLRKARSNLTILQQRGCNSLDIRRFVDAFCSYAGDLSQVSLAVFDLSNLENNHIRRATVYAILSTIFHSYSSRQLQMNDNAHPVLFAIEEARTLLPKQDEARREPHPATSQVKLTASQIATEGRKMGLGLIIISQRPASVDPFTVSQANTLILHRAINPDDQQYIREVGESLSKEDLEHLKTVKEGIAIVSGEAMKTRSSVLVKIRNRYSMPGADKPEPIREMWSR